MIKKINIAENVLRYLSQDKDWTVKNILVPTKKDELLKWFLMCLCEETSFLNSNGEYSFQKEIHKLCNIANISLSGSQINILSDLIGGFTHKHRIPIPLEKMYTLPIEIIEELTELLINYEVYLDTHIEERRDLDYYDSVYKLLDYKKYKELVFSTICRTTKCSTGILNPMSKISNKVHLKEEDYKILCYEIFSK